MQPALGRYRNIAAPARALAWELFQRGWWRTLNALLAGLGVAVIVYSSVLQSGPLDPRSGRSLHFVLVWIWFVAAAGAALAAQGDPARFYLLPLSNRVLATVTMLPGMISVSATYVLTAGLLNRTFGVGWPVWGPALLLPTALAVFQTASRIAGSARAMRIAAWIAVAMPLDWWMRGRYGGGSFLAPRWMWTTVTPRELLTLASIALGAFSMTVYCIRRDRRGDLPLLALAAPRTAISRDTVRRELAPFGSDAAAQFWFEWRHKGRILPATFVIFATFLVIGFTCHWFEDRDYRLLHDFLAYGSGLVLFALLGGLALGHTDLATANPECGSLLATRPATNASLAGALLKVEAASLLLTVALWTGALAGSTAILYSHQGLEPVLDLWTVHGKFGRAAQALGLWYALPLVAAIVLATWATLSLTTSVALAGRQRLIVTFVSAGIPVLLLGLYLTDREAAGHPLLPDAAVQYVLGSLAAAGTFGSFAMARQRRIIRAATCGGALAGWLTLCGLALGVCLASSYREPAPLACAAGLLALPLAPLATGPLAFSWNRHR
jgi:hypothetical protein